MSKAREVKFGKRVLRWFVSRLNYYLIGLITVSIRKKYLKKAKNFN